MSAQPVSLVQCQYNMGILGPRVGGGRREEKRRRWRKAEGRQGRGEEKEESQCRVYALLWSSIFFKVCVSLFLLFRFRPYRCVFDVVSMAGVFS